MKGYKGFDKNLRCRGFQYETEEEYEENIEPKCCNRGFHFCEYPLDVFNYYGPANSRFCEVESVGKVDKDVTRYDSKVSTNKIKIRAEINFLDLAKASIEYIKERVVDDHDPSTHKELDCTRLHQD